MTSTTAASSVLATAFEGIARRRLVLHLDVNRTLIQTDPAGGKTLEDVMNTNVAARVMGSVDRATRTWAALPDADPAVAIAEPMDRATGCNVMPFDEFVDEVLFPKPAAMATLAPMEAKALWAEVSDKRRQAKHGFTNPGNPGERFRSSYDRLISAMTIPSTGAAYYLIPAFFELLNTLSVIDWPFSVVFRTFGTDLPPVLQEYFTFIRGEHAIFKPAGPRLAAAKEALVTLGPDAWCPCAQLHRSTQGTFLTRGTSSMKLPEPNADVPAYYAERGLTSERVTDHQLAAAIRAAVEPKDESSAEARGVPSLGLVDYYPWWAAHGEHGATGKAFPVLPPSSYATPAQMPYQVFFDDNIRFGHPEGRSIIALKRLSAKEEEEEGDETSAAAEVLTVEPLEVQRAYLCSVDPWDAILRTSYFVDEALGCMRRQQVAASPSL